MSNFEHTLIIPTCVGVKTFTATDEGIVGIINRRCPGVGGDLDRFIAENVKAHRHRAQVRRAFIAAMINDIATAVQEHDEMAGAPVKGGAQ